ncbi:hypothetical protein CJP74_00590 [Psittacicella melopsittaci]|uniref:DNA ligase (NAD(+)) n=1 Tax=Psittacicella melopsittaci TaxID=2028576 RepID=A0A3A1Y8G9_9GAMM|nr:BRCT domain-containing protein [Psittacicella melopsittaci]RIY33955.1 hypothetical protein CJP74_00590 [Psittacicella melopsittaci]
MTQQIFLAYQSKQELITAQLLAHLEQLRSQIQDLKISYYQQSLSKVSDYEYDMLVKELEYYETTYSDFYLSHFEHFLVKDQVGSDLQSDKKQEIIHAQEQGQNQAIDDELYAVLLQSKSQFEPWQVVKHYPQVSEEEINNLAEQYQSQIISHDIPMLSLSNVYSAPEFKQFYDSVAKVYSRERGEKKAKIVFCAEPKFDGIACSLIYRNGKLVTGATRGDGSRGYDITPHVQRVPNIPQEIPELMEEFAKTGKENTLEVRGELIMQQQEFSYLNALYKRYKRKPLANLRNAAGAFVSREPYRKVVKKNDLYIIDNLPRQMPLRFMAYAVNQHENISAPEFASDTHYDLLMFARRVGFTVSELVQLVKSEKEITNFYNQISEQRPSLDFDIDGTVFKVNNLTDQEMVGWIANSPKWAIAYKFLPNEAKTQLLDVVTNIGRTGIVSPVAKVEPCFVGGVTISSLSLHNYYLLKRMDLYQQDQVIIYRGGEVIPVVKEAVVEERKADALPINILPTCPECGSFLVQDTRLQQLNRQNGQDLAIADYRTLGALDFKVRTAIDLPLTLDSELEQALALTLEGKEPELKGKKASDFAQLKELMLAQYYYQHATEELKAKEYKAKFYQLYNQASLRKDASKNQQRFKVMQSGSLSCSNPAHNCVGQLNGAIEFFYSKDGIELKGLGPNILEQFVTLGAVSSYADVYKFRQEGFLSQVSDLAKALVVHEPAFTLAYSLRADYLKALETRFLAKVQEQQGKQDPTYGAYREKVRDLLAGQEQLASLFSLQDYAHFVEAQAHTFSSPWQACEQSFKQFLLANTSQDYASTFAKFVAGVSKHNSLLNQISLTWGYLAQLLASYPQLKAQAQELFANKAQLNLEQATHEHTFALPEFLGGNLNPKLTRLSSKDLIASQNYEVLAQSSAEHLADLAQELSQLFAQVFSNAQAYGLTDAVKTAYKEFKQVFAEPELQALAEQGEQVLELDSDFDFEEWMRQARESLVQKTAGYPWVQEFLAQEQDFARDQRDYILTYLSRFTSPQLNLEERLAFDYHSLQEQDYVQAYAPQVQADAQELAKGKHLESEFMRRYQEHKQQVDEQAEALPLTWAYNTAQEQSVSQIPEYYNADLASYVASGSLLNTERQHGIYAYLFTYAQLQAGVSLLTNEQVKLALSLTQGKLFPATQFAAFAQRVQHSLVFNELYARVELINRYAEPLNLAFAKQMNDLKVMHNVGILTLDPLLDQNYEQELEGLLAEHQSKIAKVGDNLDLFLNSKEVNFTKLGYTTRSLIIANLCDFLQLLEKAPSYAMHFASRMHKYFSLLSQDLQTRQNQFKALLAPYKQKLKAKEATSDYNWKQVSKSFISKELFGGKAYKAIATGLNEKMTLKIADFLRSIGINGVGDSASVELVSPQLLPNTQALLDFDEGKLLLALNYSLMLRHLQSRYTQSEQLQGADFAQEVGVQVPGLYASGTSDLRVKISPQQEVFLHVGQTYTKFDLLNRKVNGSTRQEYEAITQEYVLDLKQALEAPTLNLIGEITYQNIVAYFKQESNLAVIKQLLGYGVTLIENKPEFSNIFANKKVCITGGLESMDRKAFSNFIKESGGKFSSSVTNELDILVVAGTPETAGMSSKLKKAQDLGKRIIYEPEFMQIYNQSTAKE